MLGATPNIVTSFHSTPDDTHYPSEKLVKDSLDEKIDRMNSSSFVIKVGTYELKGQSSGVISWAGSNLLNANSVVDSLTTTRTDLPLSANKGRELNTKFDSYLPLAGEL